ncbi:MAG: recombinase family protein [Comamonas sp.]|uniref:recombinase family protein n=1 Tax=Comamonas sp. TaxID=34028 RepID=UPI003D100F6B
MLVGYARVSTQEQDTALQLDAFARVDCDVVFQEKASGSSRRGRPELSRCLASLRKGDTLVVYKIDRIARSLFDLLDVLRHLENVGAMIKSITEPLDTTNAMGVFMIQVLGAVAQLERSMIRERSIAGQRAARERGRVPGRIRALSAEVEAQLVADYLSGLHTYKGLSLKYGVSESVAKRAVYRVTKSQEYRRKGNI